MSELIEYNATNQSLYFMLSDSTTGARKTGVAFGTVNASYVREKSNPVAITESSIAPNAAFTSGGWAEVDATNNPGLYRLDVPNAAFLYVAGVTKVEITVAATAAHAETKEIELVTPSITKGTVGSTPNVQPSYTEYSMLDGTVRKDYV